MESLGNINWLAVIVGTVVTFLVGWAWYSPKLFGTRWAEGSGVSLNRPDKLPLVRHGHTIGCVVSAGPCHRHYSCDRRSFDGNSGDSGRCNVHGVDGWICTKIQLCHYGRFLLHRGCGCDHDSVPGRALKNRAGFFLRAVRQNRPRFRIGVVRQSVWQQFSPRGRLASVLLRALPHWAFLIRHHRTSLSHHMVNRP